MLLQRGKFLVDNIPNNDRNKKIDVIDLDYMGKFEYEGNAIPLSRSYIEYHKDKYVFYQIPIFDKDGNQMYIYANSNFYNKKIKKDANYLIKLANYIIDKNYSLWEYIKNGLESSEYNFGWNIDSCYFVFFGEKYKDVINYYINYCYTRDGGREEIKRKVLKAGYEFND